MRARLVSRPMHPLRQNHDGRGRVIRLLAKLKRGGRFNAREREGASERERERKKERERERERERANERERNVSTRGNSVRREDRYAKQSHIERLLSHKLSSKKFTTHNDLF